MEFDDIEKVLALVREHELTEFELEREGLKLRVRKSGGAPPLALPQAPVATIQAPSSLVSAPAALGSPAESELAGDAEVELAVVKSPIVGTFYRSSEPGTPALVEVGQRVKKDQVLCIIEAMKLMNEIQAEVSGTIEKIYVENGQPVEYGQALFGVKK